MRLGRGAVHEILFERCGNRSSISSSMGENPWEAFFTQPLLVDFAQIVVVPQLVVDRMKGGKKLLEGGDAQVLQGIDLEEFRERFAYISVIVP